jgi:hypothetical protein
MEKSPNKKEFVLKKIPLRQFMALLNDVYQSGADFVDLYGYSDPDATQDEVIVSVPLSYLAPEFKEEAKAEQPDPPPGLNDEGDQEPFPHEMDEELTINDISNIINNV